MVNQERHASGKEDAATRGGIRRGAKKGGGAVTWPGRRGGDGVAAGAGPCGCGHASRSAVEVCELLTGAARSISSSRSARTPLSRRFVAFFP